MAMRVVAACARLPSALLVALGCALPVSAQALTGPWGGDGWPTVTIRNAGGVPVMLGTANGVPPTSAGGGAAYLRGAQSMTVGGALAELQLSRLVSVANLARAARLASSIAGPIALVGLAYEGITWVADHWGVEEGGGWQYTCCSPLKTAISVADAINRHGYKDDSYVGGVELYSGTWGESAAVWICSKRYPGSFCEVWSKGSEVPGTLRAATDAEVESAFSNALVSDPAKAPGLLQKVTDYVPVAELVPGPLVVSGPATVQEAQETTVQQQGPDTLTTIKQVTYNVTYQGSTVTVTTTTNSTTTNQNNQVVNQSTTTTQAPVDNPPAGETKQPELKVCGLPGGPACKIDESGTPKADDTVSAGQQALKTAFDARDQQLAQNTQRESFGWLPTLPTLVASCSTIQVGNIWTFDPCPGIEIGRTFFAFLWGFLALIYCWRRVGETVGGGV